jgi:hypothetical protein
LTYTLQKLVWKLFALCAKGKGIDIVG